MESIHYVDSRGSLDVVVENINAHSGHVESGDLFIAIKGLTVDGHKYIPQAIEKGAIAVVCEDYPCEMPGNVVFVKVENSSRSLGVIASNFFQKPSTKLKVIGLTGTNGKTTTATLLYRLFEALGYKAGLLSTVKNMIHKNELPSQYTTPEPIQLNRLLHDMVNAGCDYCFMEVSSHAIKQDRIEGMAFAGGIFTNLTHDHLDYHITFQDYLYAKKRFFDHLPAGSFALSNCDDKNGKIMLQNCNATKIYYALHNVADFKAKILENSIDGLHMIFDGVEAHFRFVGKFNAYNLLAVYGAAVLLDANKEEVIKKLSEMSSVEGRFEYVKNNNNVMGIVDYAHTPDALTNVLNTISGFRKGNESVITVVGCGGDRDKEKRPKMAAIACKMSNRVILTSDNPRSEDPEEIIKDMKKGLDPVMLKKVLEIVNRKEAIKTAVALAKKDDIILVAGKGHETYQEINNVKHHFDDKEILNQLLIANN